MEENLSKKVDKQQFPAHTTICPRFWHKVMDREENGWTIMANNYSIAKEIPSNNATHNMISVFSVV